MRISKMSKRNSVTQYGKTILKTSNKDKESTLLKILLLNHSDPMFAFAFSASQNGTLAQN